MATHYSLAFSPKLAKYAEVAHRMITEKFPDKKVLLYFTGFSGSAHGLAVYHKFMAESYYNNGVEIAAAFVRKDDDHTHGCLIERSHRRFNPDVCVFIDDFICSGKSVERATKKLKELLTISTKANWYAIVGSGADGYPDFGNSKIEMHQHFAGKRFKRSDDMGDPFGNKGSRVCSADI